MTVTEIGKKTMATKWKTIDQRIGAFVKAICRTFFAPCRSFYVIITQSGKKCVTCELSSTDTEKPTPKETCKYARPAGSEI